MANSDKNILITPNTGSALNPTIAFTGSNASPITMSILDTGALSFSGTSGQLFSIVDSLSGSIFSVNDISGIPSLEILDTGLVKLNQYGGNTAIGVATPYTGLISSGAARLSISTISAATAGLIVKGKPSQSENLVEFYRSSADANAVFKIQAGLYPVYIDNLAVGSNVYANYQIVGGVISGNLGNVLHQFNSWNAAWVTVGVRGAASQTANLQEWQNSSGTVLANVDASGKLTVSSGAIASTEFYSNGNVAFSGSLTQVNSLSVGAGNSISGRIQIKPYAANNVGIVVQGYASQTANLQEWQNSAGTILGEVVYTGQYINRTQIYADNTQSGSSALVAKTNYGSVTPFVVQGAPDAQTADLQKWITHSGTVLAKITGSGALDVTAITVNGAALAGYSAPTIGSTSIASGATVTTLAGLTSVSSTSFVGALTGNASTVTNGVYTNAANIITAASSTTIPIIAKAAASQTADLQQWQNSAGDVISAINSSGFFAGNSVNLANFGQLYQVGLTANQVSVVVSGATSQTADLQEWRSNQSSAAVAKIDVNGNFKGGLVYDINNQTGTSYTFVLSDSKAVVMLSNANNITASVPTNSTAFPIGSSITVIQYGQGQVTIQALTPGTTTIISNSVTPAAPRLRGILSSATLIKVIAEGWIVIGDIY